MQATGDEHDLIGETSFGVAEALFDDTTALYSGNHVLDGDAQMRHHAVENLVAKRALLSTWLLLGLVDDHAGRRKALKTTILIQFAALGKGQRALVDGSLIVY